MKLKHTKEPVFTVAEKDLNAFVKETLGHDYEFHIAQKSSNDVDYRIEISEDTMHSYEERDARGFIANGEVDDDMPSGATALWALFLEGHIEPGIYVIQVCW